MTAVPLDAKIKCTEAKDNHVEYHELSAFMKFCEQYIVGANGMLVDMPFLPRIKEGEIRLLMLRDKPINVVHKKPAEVRMHLALHYFQARSTAMIHQKNG